MDFQARRVRMLVVAAVILIQSGVALGRPCGGSARDDADVAAVRESVSLECDCQGSPTHGSYVRCAQRVAARAVAARRLRPVCKRSLVECAARSICGRSGRATCCFTRRGVTKCRASKDEGRCLAAGGHAGVCLGCCDTCDPKGCGTTTTMTSSTTTTTLPAPSCGDRSCDVGEDCATCPADCGSCSAQPTLPVAVAACAFAAQCCDDSCLPAFVLSSSDTSTAAWTAFSDPVSTTSIRGYLDRPPVCDAPGTPTMFPTLALGDAISTTDGVVGTSPGSPFALLKCLYDNDVDGREFLVPVMDAGTCPPIWNQDLPVTGFVAVRLTSVIVSGAPPSVTFQAFRRAGVPAQPGGAGCP